MRRGWRWLGVLVWCSACGTRGFNDTLEFRYACGALLAAWSCPTEQPLAQGTSLSVGFTDFAEADLARVVDATSSDDSVFTLSWEPVAERACSGQQTCFVPGKGYPIVHAVGRGRANLKMVDADGSIVDETRIEVSAVTRVELIAPKGTKLTRDKGARIQALAFDEAGRVVLAPWGWRYTVDPPDALEFFVPQAVPAGPFAVSFEGSAGANGSHWESTAIAHSSGSWEISARFQELDAAMTVRSP